MVNLEGMNAKIERARVELLSLESDIEAVCTHLRRQIIFERSQPGSLPLGDHPGLPIDYSIRVGQIAYNLRSALDHLVWQLVLVNGKIPGTRNEFPIFDSEEKYQKESKKKLKGVSADRRELVGAFQPFSLCGDIGRHLWMLHSVCNIDKHRHLNVVALHSFTNVSRPETECIVDVCFMDPELESASPGYSSPIEGQAVKRPPVLSVLSSCLAAVSHIVNALSQEYTVWGVTAVPDRGIPGAN